MNSKYSHKTILLFDGYCNLCHSSVQFVLKHEKADTLFFTSLQSATGKEILKQYKIDSDKVTSLVLIENDAAYIKSTAALRISKYLKGLYPMAFLLLIIPSFIRNSIYDYIAKNRYKWFGKKDTCIVSDNKLAQRFL